MGDVIKLARVEREIIETERKLRAIDIALLEIERDIAKIESLEFELIQNIFWLKHSDTVPVIDAYKKARADLYQASKRKQFIVTDFRNHTLARSKTEITLKKLKEEYLEYTSIQQNNVIQVDFFERKYDK